MPVGNQISVMWESREGNARPSLPQTKYASASDSIFAASMDARCVNGLAIIMNVGSSVRLQRGCRLGAQWSAQASATHQAVMTAWNIVVVNWILQIFGHVIPAALQIYRLGYSAVQTHNNSNSAGQEGINIANRTRRARRNTL